MIFILAVALSLRHHAPPGPASVRTAGLVVAVRPSLMETEGTSVAMPLALLRGATKSSGAEALYARLRAS